MLKVWKVLKLDWSAMKCYRIRLLLLPVLLLIPGGLSTIYLVPMGVLFLFSFSINAFLVEEKGGLNRLYLTLPMKRSRMVAGRYLLSFLLFLAGIIIGFALMPLANLFALSRWYPDWKWALALACTGFLIYALMNLAMYPALFRLGYEKGKVWGYYIPSFVIALGYMGIAEYDVVTGGAFIRDMLIYASEHILSVSAEIFGLGAVILAASWGLSVRLYTRREF